ncbi:hypothetical protein [Cellulosimicrobium funkei]|uniref:hypothetical protein n=1 Tax=Cellulosimicrobium funkei TaxID=264251 RepID=UPI0036C08CFA
MSNAIARPNGESVRTQVWDSAATIDRVISRKFRRLLKEKGMTHRQFAAELGITYAQLDHRMRANTSWFVEEVYRGGKLLGIQNWALLVGSDET